MAPIAPGDASLSYKICPLFTYSIFYCEVGINFSGEGGVVNFLLRGFSMGKILHEERIFRGGRGVKFSEEILYWGNLPKFLCEILFIVLLSLCRVNFKDGDVKGNCPG